MAEWQNRGFRQWGIWFVLPVLVFLLVYTHERAVETRKKNTKPGMELLYLHQLVITLGQDAVLADFYLLQSMVYVYRHLDKRDFKYLESLFQRITDLDPYYVNAYLYASALLGSLAGNFKRADKLLHKGWEHTKDWRIAVDLAVRAQMRDRDEKKALKWYEKALEDPKCPPILVGVVAKLRTKLGEIDQERMFQLGWDMLLNRLEKAEKMRNKTLFKAAILELEDLLASWKEWAKKHKPSYLEEITKLETKVKALENLPKEWH